ncbi:MAG TPA: sulfotransferase [Stellaceae bacterium]|nr:sulfotransferase [Stellaceae bacterium]
MNDTASKPANGMSAAANTADGFDFRAMHARIDALLDKQVFFLGGAVKSGTTWLQALLDAHPHVSCTGENHFVDCLSPTLKKSLEEYNRILLDPRGNTAYQLGKQPTLFDTAEYFYVLCTAMLALMLKQAGGRSVLAVGDKTTVNVQAFAQLSKLLPGSKHVHIVRDPRDGAVSGWHHVSRLFPDETRQKFPAMLDYVKHYADIWALEVGRGVAFGSQKPDRYLEIRYEDLVAQTAATLAAIFRFLGVDPGADVVQHCIKAASFETLSGGRARGQENPGSFFRKGVVGDWKTRLDPVSAEYVVATCGPLMTRFGYL